MRVFLCPWKDSAPHLDVSQGNHAATTLPMPVILKSGLGLGTGLITIFSLTQFCIRIKIIST